MNGRFLRFTIANSRASMRHILFAAVLPRYPDMDCRTEGRAEIPARAAPKLSVPAITGICEAADIVTGVTGVRGVSSRMLRDLGDSLYFLKMWHCLLSNYDQLEIDIDAVGLEPRHGI